MTNLIEAPTEFDAVFGAQHAYMKPFMDVYNEVQGLADPILFELGRLRLAEMLGSAFDQAMRFVPAQRAGLTEDKISDLANYAASELFDEREVAWLLMVEQYALAVNEITDEDCNQMLQWLTPEQFVVNIRAIYFAESLQRCVVALRVQPGSELPSTFSNFVLAAN